MVTEENGNDESSIDRRRRGVDGDRLGADAGDAGAGAAGGDERNLKLGRSEQLFAREQLLSGNGQSPAADPPANAVAPAPEPGMMVALDLREAGR